MEEKEWHEASEKIWLEEQNILMEYLDVNHLTTSRSKKLRRTKEEIE